MQQLPDKPPASLEENASVELLLPDAIALLEKDFATAGIDVQLSGKIIGDVFDLRDRIAELVKKTGGPGAETFYRLLYRADVQEAKVREALNSAPALPIETVIAELLIIRALQRAFFRKKFSS